MPTLNFGSNKMIVNGETIGLEFECDNLTADEIVQFRRNNPDWKTTRDASVESDVTDFGGVVNIKQEKNNRYLPDQERKVIGTEILSPVLDSTKCFYDILNLTSYLEDLGESPESERSSIHFHISLSSPSLKVLKTIIRLGRHFEVMFFYLGGMGYKFRGLTNDSIYCRPITLFGPSCIPYNGNYAQCFNIHDLIKIPEDIEKFWEIYGDSFAHRDKYSPVRYTWLNLLPMFTYSETYKGTLEFRIFNKSLNPFFIYTAMYICKKFSQLALSMGYSDFKNMDMLNTLSIYENGKGMALDLLNKFHELADISEVIDTAQKIIKATPDIDLPNNYVFTHKQVGNYYWRESTYTPKIIPAKEIKKPIYVDIHVLRGETNGRD